jgi:hypothetical protein
MIRVYRVPFVLEGKLGLLREKIGCYYYGIIREAYLND